MSSSVNDLPSQFSSGLTLGSDYKASTPTSAQFSGAASASGSSASPGHKPGQRPSPVGSTFKSNSSAPSPTISAQGIKEPFGGSGPVQNIATTLTPPPSAGTNLPPIFVPGVNSVLNSVTSKSPDAMVDPSSRQTLRSQSSNMTMSPSSATEPAADEDIIPTAIVIKNIPFTLKREQLLAIIEELKIPAPYALNFHFGEGTFRGLAFANFRTPVEAAAVVNTLNGHDILGRKLRVEYKKVLSLEEKERIERDKALRRMASAGFETQAAAVSAAAALAAMNDGLIQQQQHQQTMQYAHDLHHARSMTSMSGGYFDSPKSSAFPQQGVSSPFSQSTVLLQQQQQQYKNTLPPTGYDPSSSFSKPPMQRLNTQIGLREARHELDLNDPATLEIYSRILLFKDDHMRDDLAFSRNLSPEQRRTVHLVAEKLGVFHYSFGDEDDRHVVVTRSPMMAMGTSTSEVQQRMLRQNGLRRPDLVSNTSFLSPVAPPPLLRTKTSMPDLKRPTPVLTSRNSNADLRGLRSKTLGPGAQGSGMFPTTAFNHPGMMSSTVMSYSPYGRAVKESFGSSTYLDSSIADSPPPISQNFVTAAGASQRQPRAPQAASPGFESFRSRTPTSLSMQQRAPKASSTASSPATESAPLPSISVTNPKAEFGAANA